MGDKNNTLNELKKKKAAIREEIKEMEKLLRFNNVKESLSVITGGATDRFLIQKPVANSKGEVSYKTGIKLNTTAIKNSMIDKAIKLGTIALITNFAKKNLEHSSWKKKLLGFIIIYGTPILLKKVTDLIDDWQETKLKNSKIV